MLFEPHSSQDLLTPSIIDGGVNKLNSSLTSLDFYLLDDIDAYFTSPVPSKKPTRDLINDSINDNHQHQDELFFDFDFPNCEENSDFFVDQLPLDELDIEKYISQSSFLSPPMDMTDSPASSIEDTSSSKYSSSGEEYLSNIDMVVPPSPPLSSSSSSPQPLTKKPKLTVVERKIRKKGQNKTAAEKYRIKKKSERHQLIDRHTQLSTINKELKSKLENLTFRIDQFKQIFSNYLPIASSTSN